jgi:membrane protein DedA with SNARE-associated domain
MHEALDLLSGIPAWLVYLALGAGAALENLVPPVPADSFVVVGGFLASREVVDPFTIWLVTWGTNVAGALSVYFMGWRHGRVFFEEGAGRWLLNRAQLDRVDAFYRRWGTVAVFLARFLPGLRAIVPAFAGIGHLGVTRTALSIASASALWYGALVAAGHLAGRNLDRVEAWLLGTNRILLGLAIAVAVVIAVAWWRTRHEGGRGA